jgi:hypothetical protein
MSPLEALERIAGEAPFKEPRDEPTIALASSYSRQTRDYVDDLIREAFDQGYARALWEMGQIADKALKTVTE